MKININADMGESFGAYCLGNDEELLKAVSSANIASGFHAGDPWIMTETLQMALDNGVSVGVHPAFHDLQGFGRRVMQIAPHELRALVLYQIGALEGIARTLGSRVTHVKPHGALNNMACVDYDLAENIVTAMVSYDPTLILLAPVCSELAKVGIEHGLPVALEVFADRAYDESGQLVSRSQPGSVFSDPADCVENVRGMLNRGGIESINGKIIKTDFHSICVHGDNQESVRIAIEVREFLESEGIEIVTLPHIMKSI